MDGGAGWSRMLDDLENRFDAERRAQVAAQGVESAAAEAALIRLVDRLRGRVGQQVRLRTRGGNDVDGILTQMGDGIALIDEPDGLQAVVPLPSIAVVVGLAAAAPEPRRPSRATLATVLRELGRRGSRTRLLMPQGDVVGRIARVGADHVDILGAVAERRTRISVSFDAIDLVRSG
ncbi:Fis family transcriptional regulator [Actinomyces sp. zg296]|uniref:Fis family transcriptional regulator n=1 Tax=Actinomyces sp. zg296 TaxID=2609289 RepID=UPI001356BDD7|nr:Fis family transcriptional regulator [Actinomyces sp. zg296]